MTSPYDDLGFAEGSVKGLRAYNFDKLGRLHSPFKEFVWRPGENVAKCSAPGHHKTRGMPKCDCGFYAFYNGDDEYAEATRVSAVIEGYGETVIGTKGFRAQKAKIVAMTLPKVQRRRWDQPVIDAIYRVDAEFAAMIGGWVAFILLIIIGIPVAFTAPLIGIPLLLLGIASGYLGVIGVLMDSYTLKPSRTLPAIIVTPEALSRIQHNYPDVQFYTNKAAMLRDHPVKREEPEKAITPETREDFWELKLQSLSS